MNVGFATRDITPEPGITLSGFAARCNAPSEGVDDPLSVFALALEQGAGVLILVFDLLGLGAEITEEIQAALDECPGMAPRAQRILCCTHTHSAPATVTLLGCGIPEPTYWRRVVTAAVEAARDACARLQPATLRMAAIPLPGANYNRRRVLVDGRVVMAQHPPAPVAKVGPTWDFLHLLRFDDAYGRPIAGAAHWATHPCTVCTRHISADYPGELRRGLAARFNMPFLFLQGACGNLNPPFEEMTRSTMLRNVAEVLGRIETVTWSPEITPDPFTLSALTVPLPYSPRLEQAALKAIQQAMARLADTGECAEETVAAYGNILNVKAGERVDPLLLRHIAGCMRDWSAAALADTRTTCDIALHVLRLGRLVLCGVAAEPFVETALELQARFPRDTVLLLGYASPVVGYLPTDDALDEGGYEAESAYRFYAHPASFARGAESLVREALAAAIRAGSAESIRR